MLNIIALTNDTGLKGKLRLGVAGILLFAGLFLAQSGFAQDPPPLPSLIYEANSSNNRINKLTFDPNGGGGASEWFNTETAPDNATIQALGFRPGGFDLVAADRRGELEVYRNLSEPPITICDASVTPNDCPARPDGITTAADFMAVVDSAPDPDQPSRVWSFPVCDYSTCPSGFDTGQIVDDDVCIGTEDQFGVCDGPRARVLSETELVRGAFNFDDDDPNNDDDPENANGLPDAASSGDVLILVEDPAALLVLPNCMMTGACQDVQPKVVIPTSIFGGVAPTGMTWIQSTPYVLIASADGVIQRWIFDDKGVARISPDFDGDAGSGSLKIKSGTDENGDVIAVLNRRNHGDSFLYQVAVTAGTAPIAINGVNGLGPVATISDLQFPNGLALANAAGIDDTSACESGCAPAGILNHLFPAGTGDLGFLIESVTHVLSDPRGDCDLDNPDHNIAANEFDLALPTDVIIPNFLCGQTDLYFITATLENPVPDGVVVTTAFESLLENPPLAVCYDGSGGPPPLEHQLVQVWAPFGAESDIVESPTAIENTIGCTNPSRSGGKSLSLIVVGLSYAPNTIMVDVATEKLQGLKATVTASACNRGKPCKQAAGAIKSAIRNWTKGEVTKTLKALNKLEEIVDFNSGLFNGNTNENFAGNILARIQNFRFTNDTKIAPYL